MSRCLVLNHVSVAHAPEPGGSAVVPRQGTLPPAALALARLIGEMLGERLWREALAAVEGQAVAEDAGEKR